MVFHCGYRTYLEAGRQSTPEDPIGECTYDDSGCLDKYPGCQGTPDQYTADEWWNHTINDSGGIYNKGGEAFMDSRRKDIDDIKNFMDKKAEDIRNNINNTINSLVDNIVRDIKKRVQDKVNKTINDFLTPSFR